MNTHVLNIFIVNKDPVQTAGLRHYLEKRFGINLNIFSFYTDQSALDKIDGNTGIIVLDYSDDGKQGVDVLESIKIRNPNTKIVMLASNEEIGKAVDTIQNGPDTDGRKGSSVWKRIPQTLKHRFVIPVQKWVKEFLVRRYLVLYFLVFCAMGLLVYFLIGA